MCEKQFLNSNVHLMDPDPDPDPQFNLPKFLASKDNLLILQKNGCLQ